MRGLEGELSGSINIDWGETIRILKDPNVLFYSSEVSDYSLSHTNKLSDSPSAPPAPSLHHPRPLTPAPIMRRWSNSGAGKNGSSIVFAAKQGLKGSMCVGRLEFCFSFNLVDMSF
jgi:hypothetical protein